MGNLIGILLFDDAPALDVGAGSGRVS